MTTNTITPGAIAVGYSGERDADHALAWAAEQARLEHRPLALIHALQPMTGFVSSSLAAAYLTVDDLTDTLAQEGRAILASGSEIVAERFPDVAVEVHLYQGAPERILEEVGEHASLLVLGSRGRGRIASALLGSVSVTVASRASCPVVVVRPFHRGKVRNGVLVGTDCGRDTRTTLEFAYREASLRQLPLTVLYSVPGLLLDEDAEVVDGVGTSYEQHRRELAEAVAGMGEKFPDVRVQTYLGSGLPDRWLISQSESMDLLVVGQHRRAGLADRLAMGSYAPLVVEKASCPTAVVFEPPA